MFLLTALVIYFIPSSGFSAYLKHIKVVFPTVKNIVFLASGEYDLYFFAEENRGYLTVANRCYFHNIGLNFFPKRSECNILDCHYAAVVRTSNEATDVTL